MKFSKSTLHQSVDHSSDLGVSALRLKFLTPLVAAIVLLVFVLAISLFYFESENQNHGLIHERLSRTQSVAKVFYENSIQNDAMALSTVIKALQHDEKLRKIFSSYDRNALLQYTETLFKEFKRDYGITHFYFTGPDRINLLRVHTPDRYGDKINRVTTLRAEQSGEISYGVELGVLGTFTLRVVSPWFDLQTGQLIGYVELGMEVDHIIDRLRHVFGFYIAVVINKKYLDRQKWENGMKLLDRSTNWDRFKNVVLAENASRGLPTILSKRFKQGQQGQINKVEELKHHAYSYWLLSIPLIDARGRDVAEMTLLADVSNEMNVAQRTVLVVGAAVFVLGGLLVAFFSWLAGRIGQRIEHDEMILKRLATQDSLTGLYTRRVFHEFLEDELDRSARFSHPLSLLLIDIDYFKKVNDSYGHQAGDIVLQRLSEQLQKEARALDLVCRFGGEEIAIILPETEINGAQRFARRINKSIASLPFLINDDLSIHVTVSIGVSSYPLHADSDTSMISAADKALYDAKEGGRDRTCIYADKK